MEAAGTGRDKTAFIECPPNFKGETLMRTLWIASLAALAVASAPLAYAQTDKPSTPPTKPQAQQTPKAGKADRAFIQQALKSGMEEVELAKLAAEKSQNDQIKQFAQMLVSDHTAVNEQLKQLSERNGVTTAPRDGTKRSGTETSPPITSPGAAPSSPKAQQLAKLSGSQFDKAFMKMVVEGHEKSVDLYSKESERGADPTAKKLANETLPKIKEHLSQAKSLQQQVMDKKTQ
jgi:putative membrane protein